jgi:deoxyribodipyrimidine photolyase
MRHDYPWASDRLHTFMLEGVRDLVSDFAARGIQYAFHLDRRSSGTSDGDEELDRGETHDERWNAGQRSYLRDGWMHNSCRMLWSKSVIGWPRMRPGRCAS